METCNIFIKRFSALHLNLHLIRESFLRYKTNIYFSFYTAWKASKYGIFSGPYFPVFGLNTEIYEVNLRIQSEYRKLRTRRNSVFGHFSRIVNHPCRSVISIKLLCNFIEIALQYGCSPVNLLHIFRTPFTKNKSERLLLL